MHQVFLIGLSDVTSYVCRPTVLLDGRLATVTFAEKGNMSTLVVDSPPGLFIRISCINRIMTRG